MPKLSEDATRLRRDESPLGTPGAIAEGITASPEAVWAWVVIPDRSTDELNTSTIEALTLDGASALRRLLPADTEFHIKVQWGRWSGADYAAQERARIVARRGELTAGQEAYIKLAADRIDANAFPRRQVLLGIRLSAGSGGQLPEAMRTSARRVGGEGARVEDSRVALHAAADAAHAWHDRMAGSALQGRPATVRELAWALRRDLRRTVTWLPDGPLASRGQVARLRNGCRVDPEVDHVVIRTDAGPSYLRFLTCSQVGFPSSDMELPGGEWLKDLIIGGEYERGPARPIEVSVRGRSLSQPEAAKLLRDAQALTKEQEREAAHGVAEDAPEEVIEARAVLGTRLKEVRQSTVGMVLDCPVWVVEGADLAELDRRTSAVVDSYGGRGIDLWTPEDVQDLLYKESVLGDRLRFRDVEQLRPMTTLVGSWFHGGSVVGSETGPMVGGVIGSTPRPYRNRLTDAQLENEPVTSVFVGRSRAGKSTAVELSILGELVLDGAWAAITDYKGDLAGIVPAARMFGVPVFETSTSAAASGSMCPFRYVSDPAEAASMVVDNLLLMLRPSASVGAAEHYLRVAAEQVAARPEALHRSTYDVVQLLRSSQAAEAHSLGEELATLSTDPLALPVAGRPDLEAPTLPTGAGLVYMRFDTLRMPAPGSAQATWKAGERLSVMLLQSGFAYLTYMAGRVKGIPKLVGLTELHLLTPHAFGRQLIGFLARMGAALDVDVLLDTQAVAELLDVPGLLDQVSSVHAFRVSEDDEADAQARLLQLEPEDTIRARQKGWRPGQCLVRDRWGRVGPVQFDYLCAELAEVLSTTPKRNEPVDVRKAALAEAAA